MEVIYFTWLIIAIIFRAFKKYQQIESLINPHRYLIVFISIFFLLREVINISIQFYGDYFLENLNSYQNRLGVYLTPLILLTTLVLIVPTLNSFKRFREESKFQNLMQIIIFLFLIFKLGLYGIQENDFTISIIPDWHTTIYVIGFEMLPVIFLGMIFMDVMLKSMKGQ